MALFVSILLYVASALTLAMGRRLNGRLVAAAALAPYTLQLLLVGALWNRDSDVFTLSWIPTLGLQFRIAASPLNLVLTAVVALAGLVIASYSLSYFSEPLARRKFLAMMALFSGGMAGIVVSDDLFGLFVFWEVTTVASYLLIGFDDEKATARASALQAVLVTTAGGLAMLAGFVLLVLEAGTSTISELAVAPLVSITVNIALALIFIGAFSKSAQFPFHFWLPGAMAAPTPASAFLHSATMVKAGIVLLMFLSPAFAQEQIWTYVVTGTGLVTMAIGAVAALRQFDLKLLLAHGTVSQLGFMVALVGLDLTGAALAVLVGHALFKAALFLVVGVVDKATGTRDLRRLSGLSRSMPWTAAAAGIATASMAGIPPALGFATKEAAFEELIGGEAWLTLAVIAIASALTVAYSARFYFGAFGVRSEQEPQPAKRVSRGLVVGPIILAGLTVAFGLFPRLVQRSVADAVDQELKLVLWPGFKPALLVSLVVLSAGVLLYRNLSFTDIVGSTRDRSTAAYAATVRGINRLAERVTGVLQNGSLPVYLAVILTTALAVPATVWVLRFREPISLPIANSPAEIVLVGVVMTGAFVAVVARRRMAAVLLLGVVGYSVAGIFVVFGAPDLALTQLLIETLTIALFALVLARLPRRFGVDPKSLLRRSRLAISAFVGLFVFGAALLASAGERDRSVADRYVELSEEAGGRNVVNVILTNFRAIDTLGEITVLAAAAVGISVLVRNARRTYGEVSAE